MTELGLQLQGRLPGYRVRSHAASLGACEIVDVIPVKGPSFVALTDGDQLYIPINHVAIADNTLRMLWRRVTQTLWGNGGRV